MRGRLRSRDLRRRRLDPGSAIASSVPQDPRDHEPGDTSGGEEQPGLTAREPPEVVTDSLETAVVES